MAGLSRRAYARHRGCVESAVRQALAAGRIHLEPDGTLDPVRADADWARSTTRTKPGRQPDWLPGLEPVSASAVASVKATLAEAGEAADQRGPDDLDDAEDLDEPEDLDADDSGITLTAARKAKTIQETHLTRLKVQQLRGELVDRKHAEHVVFETSRAERDQFLGWPARVAPQLAATLKVEPRDALLVLEDLVREFLEELADGGPISLEEKTNRRSA